jgi:hypothetical protein
MSISGADGKQAGVEVSANNTAENLPIYFDN